MSPTASEWKQLQLVGFECPDHSTYVPFVGRYQLQKYWGQKSKATSKVTLKEPPMMQNYECNVINVYNFSML